MGDVEVKRYLVEVLNHALEPLRARREALALHPSQVIEILTEGTRQARPIAQETLSEAMEKMGMSLSLELYVDPSRPEERVLRGIFC